MQSPPTPDQTTGTPAPKPIRGPVVEPDFSRPPRPIAELARLPDFPRCAHGEHVDIGGSIGVIVDIVNQSIKLRRSDGITQSFNANRLLTLYGPRPEPVVMRQSMEQPTPLETPKQSPVSSPSPPTPTREVIEEPNFEAPIKRITELINRPDFPKCAYGEHVEIGGYVGVVVEIVKQNSLRVRSVAGTSRNYNADSLRKIYGRG